MVKILAVIEAEIATTQLIRQILSACSRHNITYRTKLLSELTPQDFDNDTLPLIIRSCDPTLDKWLRALKQAHHPYVYYIDDNFWDLAGDSLLARYYRHPAVRDTLDQVVRQAAVVITNTQPLANVLRQHNRHVEVLPAFFNFDFVRGNVSSESNEIRIGFAGSSSRQSDLKLIVNLIPTILSKYPRVVFEFAGVLPPGIETSQRIRFFAYRESYEEFIRFKLSRNWRIGLAPLLAGAANRCKTDNKFREYGACGIAGIYSRVQPYVDSVEHDLTGLLVENHPDAWLNAVTELVEKPEKAGDISRAAREFVETHYSTQTVAWSWAKMLRNVSTSYLDENVNRIRVREPGIWAARLGQIRHISVVVSGVYKQGGVRPVMKKVFARLTRKR